MKLAIDRERKLILLRWLKQGYIDTMDLPEAYKDSTYFFELMKESCFDEEERQDGFECKQCKNQYENDDGGEM